MWILDNTGTSIKKLYSIAYNNNLILLGLILAVNKVIVDADTNKKVSIEEILSSTRKPR